MIEKGKISALQMGIIMYPTIIATALLFSTNDYDSSRGTGYVDIAD